MLETVKKLLEQAGVYAWELSEVSTEGWEFYFIRHQLDQNRAKSVRHIQIKVYQQIEDGQFVGSASAELPPTATAAEAEKLIADLAYRATLVKNRAFTLNPPRPAEAAAEEPVNVAGIAEAFLRAMRSLPETETEDVNSYEIFVSEKTRRLLSSTGIDVTERFPASMIEVVVNARRDGHEIELYRNFRSGSCDEAALHEELARAMAYGRDRLRTRPTPNLGKADVLFSSADACSLYEYFAERLDAQMIYRRMSDWQVGTPIAEDIRGDRVTVRALRHLDNSSANRRWDAEGAPIRDAVLMEADVPKEITGSRMFSCYLGLENAFIPGNLDFSGGTHSEEELRRGPYLEAVEFSDFQVDAMTGDIFGELRLGYWHDGETVTPVSGGSVSGSMADFVKELYMSREQVQHNNLRIPALTLLRGVTVTGAEG